MKKRNVACDPFRPVFHLASVCENWIPGDPNGYFYADDKHHLMYLYQHENTCFRWGHLSSVDLIHWKHHPDALTELPGDGGCFSGGAFVDDDGTAYLVYWIFTADMDTSRQGIGIASAKPPYEHWTRMEEPIITSTAWGIKHFDGFPVGCADPSNIWKENGIYYLQAGNKCVLDNYGRNVNSPDMFRGDWTDLYSSENMKSWHWLGRFYRRISDGITTLDSEDDMCPSFLRLPSSKAGVQLTNKYLQLFISHNRGCQYYIGTMVDQCFFPEQHGRMSWVDDTVFAPEAAIDDQKRQIMWAWLRDDLPNQFSTRGWCGVYALPRVLWLREDGALGIAPAQELTALRVRELDMTDIIDTERGKQIELPVPETCEIAITCSNPEKGCTLRVLERENGEHVEIGYDPEHNTLYVDATNSGSSQRAVREEAPLQLSDSESLELTVYVDRSVIEVFANDRQAVLRRVYNSDPVCSRITLSAQEVSIRAWELGEIRLDEV